MKEIKEKYESLVAEVITVETEKGYCASTVNSSNKFAVRRWDRAGEGFDY